jgi:hypothetical protein
MGIPNIAKWLLAAILTSTPSCLLAHPLTEPGAPGAKVWGDPVNGLQISLYFDQTGTSPQLKVGLRNVGTFDITVTLGVRGHFLDGPDFIQFILTDDQGKSQRIGFSDPADAHRGIGPGNVVAWQEQLTPGASFSIPVNVDYFGYFSPVKPWGFEKGWQPGGTYLLQAELLKQRAIKGKSDGWRDKPSYQFFHVEGPAFSVKSNELQVHIPHE